MQLYDSHHQPCGTAPRSRVRRENLRHGATGVVVRDPLGRAYVHRRTTTKDVYPGLYDFAAGGVITAGEEPDASARREVAEELGIHGVELRRIGVAEYGDEYTRYVSFQYEATYDGPIRWQPEEVAWGDWMTLEALSERLDGQEWEFVPDSQAMIRPWLTARLKDRIAVDDGWDSRVTIAEGRWVDREPRRPEVRGWLLAEVALMPVLAQRLPLDVPIAHVVGDDPLRVRHRVVAGEPLAEDASEPDGYRLGRFLRALHATPIAITDGTGVRNGEASAREWAVTLGRFERDVLPRLPPGLTASGERLLTSGRDAPRTSIVHGDIGPEHVLCTDGVSGVIDWADVHIGDPSMDLAWALFEAPSAFAAGVAEGYGVAPDKRKRALDWHRLGPWHEVVYGLDTGRDELVDSGMRGVVDRLST